MIGIPITNGISSPGMSNIHHSTMPDLPLQEAGREMLRHRRDRGGELWISALPFFTSTVLIPALADFKRRNPATTLRVEATHQYADFNSSPVDVAIRYGREHSTGLKFEPLVEVTGLPVCAPALVKAGLHRPEDLSRQVLST